MFTVLSRLGCIQKVFVVFTALVPSISIPKKSKARDVHVFEASLSSKIKMFTNMVRMGVGRCGNERVLLSP